MTRKSDGRFAHRRRECAEYAQSRECETGNQKNQHYNLLADIAEEFPRAPGQMIGKRFRKN